MNTGINNVPNTNPKRSYNTKRATLPNIEFKVNKRAKRLDKTHFNTVDTPKYIQMTDKLAHYRKVNGLAPEGLETLFSIYAYYVNGCNGVTVFMLCKAYKGVSKVNSELNSVNKRVVRLLAKGLIHSIGKSSGSALLYAPTSKAIEDLENLCK